VLQTGAVAPEIACPAVWHAGAMNAPLDSLPVSPVQRRQLDFVLAAHELTTVSRLNRLLDGSRAETSAEHSWHLALTALALAPEVAPDVDLASVVAMLLIHDLPEVYAGDVPIYDEAARVDIVAAEQEAAVRIFAKLPARQGRELLALWREFERGETKEARFAKAIDRLQPLALHWAGDGAVWAERQVTVDQERRLMAAIERYWPPLAPVATALIDDAHQRGLLPAAFGEYAHLDADPPLDRRAEPRHRQPTPTPHRPEAMPRSLS
jgi:putative hydrolase of HD superfamily